MAKKTKYDAVIIGSGPNGLAAGITLAKAGLSVLLVEGKSTVGGGTRSAELTLPGFTHDICSAIHPLGIDSPFFRRLPLDQHGLEWVEPQAPLAHPFDDGTAIILERSIEKTCQHLGRDGTAYRRLIEPLATNWPKLSSEILAPLHFPQHPLALARFGLLAIRSASGLTQSFIETDRARAFFGGLAAHSIMPLDRPLTAAFGLILAILGHVVGWPIARGGSQNIANALASLFRSLGGEIAVNMPIAHIDQLPKAKAYLFDVTPKQLSAIAGSRLPANYLEKLKKYRYGPGVFKIDWALSNPIPWKAKECTRAGTVHIGATFNELLQSERDVWKGELAATPFVLLAQQSLFDTSRAPSGKQTAWAYCHVPNGSLFDMLERIESQIERFAPGFKESVLARKTMSTLELEHYNPNYIGGDINGGVQDLYQLFTRPVAWLVPYATPTESIYICSSSTPPGGGVHGMCGYHAARAVMKNLFSYH